jgi:hypothetical protein
MIEIKVANPLMMVIKTIAGILMLALVTLAFVYNQPTNLLFSLLLVLFFILGLALIFSRKLILIDQKELKIIYKIFFTIYAVKQDLSKYNCLFINRFLITGHAMYTWQIFLLNKKTKEKFKILEIMSSQGAAEKAREISKATGLKIEDLTRLQDNE